MHCSLYAEPPRLSARPGPVFLPPRPRSTSVPPIPITVQKIAQRYMPVTENVTPPISPTHAYAMDPETPPPTQRPGRSRGRGKWRTTPIVTPGVGTRNKTRKAELDAAEATQAQASHAVWPEQPDHTLQIQRMTRDLQIRDKPQDMYREIQKTLPRYKIDENQNEVRPLAAGIHSQQQDVFFIPPPHAGGGTVGGINPREHGYSGDDPQSGPIFSGTAMRGPSLFGRTHDAP